MSGTVSSQPPVRRMSPGLGPLVALALVLLVGLVGVRAWQLASQAPASPSPSAGTAAQAPSASPSESLSPTPAGSASATPSPSSDDAATARAVATRYEMARASGDWQTAWSMLSAYSQRVIGSLATFEELEQAYNASGGTTFKVEDPTRDPALFAPEFLGQAYLDIEANADIDRAWLLFIDHPDVRGASAANVGLLVAPVSDHWYVWIAH